MANEFSGEQLLALVKELRSHQESRTKMLVGPLTTLLIAAVGVFISWGAMMKTTEYLQAQVDALQSKITTHELEITQLKIEQTKNDTMLIGIKEDVKEVRENVNKLVKRKGF